MLKRAVCDVETGMNGWLEESDQCRPAYRCKSRLWFVSQHDRRTEN